MICATPCIVSFNKRFKKHERINLLWSNCQQATRGAFGRACEALVFGPKCAAFFMWQICNKKRKTTKSKNMFDLNVTPAEELLFRYSGQVWRKTFPVWISPTSMTEKQAVGVHTWAFTHFQQIYKRVNNLRSLFYPQRHLAMRAPSRQHVRGYSCNRFLWLGLDPEA